MRDTGTLAALVDGRLIGDATVPIDDVVHDSRQARLGALFVAVPGLQVDGHRFVPQAVAAGASAVCLEQDAEVGVPRILVPDTRQVLPLLAAEVHGRPAARLRMVGVTGTNGKTTVTHMIESIGRAAGRAVGVIGTIGARSHRRPIPAVRTTPESSDLQRLLATMLADGDEIVAMEVSSHALELGRVEGIPFRVGAFTNLSRDHLDFHRDLESYFSAKARLFEQCERAVINVDDAWGDRLAAALPDPLTVGGRGVLRAEQAEETWHGTTFTLRGPDWAVDVDLPMPGSFNLSNALVAAGVAIELGIPPEAVAAGLGALIPVAGRFETIETGQPFTVVVDYAHTPDGISAVIEAARRMTGGRIIVVVGAGGDRDQEKRPLMGSAAAAADVVWVTSDNPRSEDPGQIIQAVRAGIGRSDGIRVEADRRAAIRGAVSEAAAGDAVLVLGKGHEQGQELADRTIPFDDRDVASAALAEATR